jgi:PadR family transcriptional regulator PadR
MSIANELKKGSAQTLVLAVLLDGPRHGYSIAREIERRSADVLSFGEGALYPALRSMERRGLILGAWEVQESGPARRVYSLTDEGRKTAAQYLASWQEFSQAFNRVIVEAPNAQPA